MEGLTERINEALAREEGRAEAFASNIRLLFLVVLTLVALLNSRSVSFDANALNFGALFLGYVYGGIVVLRMRHAGYHRAMKYVTSSLDVLLVFLLLFMYARIEIPPVALKNYVFLVLFPVIGLTAFRYDRMLTLMTGGLAVVLYVGLFLYLSLSGAIVLTNAGYAEELFSEEITYVGQLTKILILGGFVLLLSYLARYSRRLFATLIRDELSLRSQKEMMDVEMRIASQVQNGFLPHSFPEIAGLEICGEVQQGRLVGGDYYDFMKLADDRLLLVTADVSGKGVPAALIMAEVRATTQLLGSMHTDLVDAVQQLNTLLHQSTDKKSFVTFFAAEIDTVRRCITYVNAGHPPPLIWSKGEVHSLARGTLPLGVSASLSSLSKRSEPFLPGDVFVSYTDGIIEQMDAQGDQYGETRLLEYVRSTTHLDVEVMTRRLFEEVRLFARGKDLDDDATLAIVKYLPWPGLPVPETAGERQKAFDSPHSASPAHGAPQ